MVSGKSQKQLEKKWILSIREVQIYIVKNRQMKNALKKLLAVQMELKCKKDKKAKNYSYRSAEDILESLKPILEWAAATILMKDEVVEVGNKNYFKSTITFYDLESEETIENYSMTRESESSQFMSDWQVSWATISYCRKYALCGMFAIDDGEDLDKKEMWGTDKEVEEFKNKVEKLNMEDNEQVEKILEEWRNLVKRLKWNAKAEITEICIGIKSANELPFKS